MVAPVNEFDTILQAEPKRTLAPRGGIILSATPNVVTVNGGVGTPSIVTLVASPLVVAGSVAWSTSPTVPLTFDSTGLIATLRYSDMGTGSVTVTATLTSNGLTYTDSRTISQVSIGSLGYTGALNATANNTAQGTLANRPTGGNGDFYFATDTLTLYQKVGGVWQAAGNNFTNTSQLIDGAGLGTTATWGGVSGTGKPADNATANVFSQGTLLNRPTGSNGDLYFATDTQTLYQKVGGSWVAAANNYTNTSQLTDGAGLGQTAVWGSVSGTGKPADGATVNNVSQGTLAARPTGGNGDFYFATDTLILYQKVAGAWAVAGNHFTNTTQLTDGAGLGQTATWTGVTGSGKPIDFRVITQGNSRTATLPAALGFYIGGTINSVASASIQRSYSLVVLNRATGAVISATAYDVYGVGTSGVTTKTATDLANDLNALGPDKVVVVTSYDEPQTNRLTGGLSTAMLRCGASRTVFGSANFKLRSAYVLVGIPGCGEGNGAEAYQGSIDNDPNAWVDVGFTLTNGALTGITGVYSPVNLSDFSKATNLSDIGTAIGTYVSPGTARTQISDTGIRVYDSSNNLRIKIGQL
jgi:hypothetical protein